MPFAGVSGKPSQSPSFAVVGGIRETTPELLARPPNIFMIELRAVILALPQQISSRLRAVILALPQQVLAAFMIELRAVISSMIRSIG